MAELEYSAPGREVAGTGNEYFPPGGELSGAGGEYFPDAPEVAGVRERSDSAPLGKARRRSKLAGALRQAAAAVAIGAVTITAAVTMGAAPPAGLDTIPYAGLTGSQRAYLAEIYDAAVKGDAEAVIAFTEDDIVGRLYEDIIVPYADTLLDGYGIPILYASEHGTQAQLSFDGRNACYDIPVPVDRPVLVLSLFFFEDNIELNCSTVQNGYDRMYNVRLGPDSDSADYLKRDGLASVTGGTAEQVILHRESDDVRGIAQWVAAGALDTFTVTNNGEALGYRYFLKDGAVTVDLIGTDGGRTQGRAIVEDAYTASWEGGLSVTSEDNGLYHIYTVTDPMSGGGPAVILQSYLQDPLNYRMFMHGMMFSGGENAPSPDNPGPGSQPDIDPSTGYPLARLSDEQLELMKRTYNAAIDGDLDAIEELACSGRAADLFYNVMEDYSQLLADQYGMPDYFWYDDEGLPACRLMFDGSNAGCELAARDGRPVMKLDVSVDPNDPQLGRFTVYLSENGYERSVFVTMVQGYAGVHVMSSYFKTDALPSGREGETSWILLSRNSEVENGGYTVTQATFTGSFEHINGVYILADGTADFECTLSTGEHFYGGALVENSRTVQIDDTLIVTIETAYDGTVVHTMWLQCADRWTTFTAPRPLPSTPIGNAPHYRQFPFIIWLAAPTRGASPYNGQILSPPQ